MKYVVVSAAVTDEIHCDNGRVRLCREAPGFMHWLG